MEALVDGKLVSPGLYQQQMTFTPLGPFAGYGLGTERLGDFIGHNGWIPGFTGIAMRDPTRGVTIAVRFNKSVDEQYQVNNVILLELTNVLFPGEMPWWGAEFP